MKSLRLVIVTVLTLCMHDLDAANRVVRETFEWDTLSTPHFSITYPQGMDHLGTLTAKFAEEAYLLNASYLGHETSRVIQIIVYPSASAFQENTVSDEPLDPGIGGFTELQRGRVVLPFEGDYRAYRHVLSHELVHAFQFDLASSRLKNGIFTGGLQSVPLWMIEGLAEYISAGYDESADMVMRDIIYNDRYTDLMLLSQGYAGNYYLFYKEGQSFYFFLEKKYGRKACGDLFKAVVRLHSLEDGLKTVTGKTIKEINAEWLQFFKLEYYPLTRGKKFDQSAGRRYTEHEEGYSSRNISPAVSPDGKQIAYITDDGIYASISIMEPGKKKPKKIRVIAESDSNSRYEHLHLLDNSISWTPDGKGVVFCAKSYGRDTVFIVSSDTGSVIERIDLPFRAVRSPAISRSGDFIVFTAQDERGKDVFVYSRKDNSLLRITDDMFDEKNPVFDAASASVIYSSNKNQKNDFESGDYAIYRKSLTGTDAVVIVSGSRNINPAVSPDGKTMLYVSDRNGIQNLYLYNFELKKSEPQSDLLTGLFSPAYFPDGKRIVFSTYQNLGFDLAIAELPLQKDIAPDKKRETIRETRTYSASYIDYTKTHRERYLPGLTSDAMQIMGIVFGGSNGFGVAGFLGGTYSDVLGRHKLNTSVMYYGYEGLGGGNADINYLYHAGRSSTGLGFFTQGSPFGIASLDTVNQLIYNIYGDTVSMKRYGMYGQYRYPFTKFIRFEGRFVSSRYEWDYTRRDDIFANLNTLEAALIYDTTVWSYMGPADGSRIVFQAEKSVNATGQDQQYQSYNADLRRYFFFRDYYTFAFRAAGGRIRGKNAGNFKYTLGGFNTIRGYSWGSLEGSNMFLFNAEFRFITVEGIKFGFPLFFGIRGIGGVIFADAGSAWDGSYSLKKADGTFDFLKADAGFGFRLYLVPAVSLKLDFAWPYNSKSFLRRNILFSVGMDY